jgi:hypothetical protein
MAENKKFCGTTAAMVFIAVVFCLFIPLKAAQNEEPAQYDPDIYKNSDIKYRDPQADKPFLAADKLSAARGYLTLGFLPEAVDCYKGLINDSGRDAIENEYAYALALGGYFEPAMLYLDENHMKNPANPDAYYYAGKVFGLAGYNDISVNFMKIASGESGYFSSIASREEPLKKSIGIVSCADVDIDFKKELFYMENGGAVVLNVIPGKSALETHDIIMKIGDREISNSASISGVINSLNTAGTVNITVWRGKAKKIIQAKIISEDSELPAVLKGKTAPDDSAKEKLVRAVSLLADKKYFTSALIYRGLINDYPDWVIPYLGYTLALEKAGAFQCAKEAAVQAAAAAVFDKEIAAQIKAKIKQLEAAAAKPQNSWRFEQTADTFAEKPAGFYLGFGGGQMVFGGKDGFRLSVNGRFGMLFNTGEDISLNLGIDSSIGSNLGIVGIQRYYLGEDFSANAGALAGIGADSAGLNVSAGLTGGGSIYYDNKKSSLDLMLNMRAYLGGNNKTGVEIYLGTTRYM